MIKFNLSILMALKGINQKELSEKTGVGKNSISKYINDNYEKIDRIHLDKFCNYFECSISDLLIYEEEKLDDLFRGVGHDCIKKAYQQIRYNEMETKYKEKETCSMIPTNDRDNMWMETIIFKYMENYMDKVVSDKIESVANDFIIKEFDKIIQIKTKKE